VQFIISINKETSSVRTMTKSEANETSYRGWKITTLDWNESKVKTVFKCEWMSGLSTDGYKRRDSIVGMGVLFLDIDDETPHGTQLLEIVHQRLSNAGYAHAIATSANHMREKRKMSGELLPAIPRLKLMIPLTKMYLFKDEDKRECWNAARSRITNYFEKLLGVELDHSSLDANRYSYRIDVNAPNFDWRFSDGKGFDCARFAIPRVGNAFIDASKHKTAERFGKNDERVKQAAKFYLSQHRNRDDWVKVCLAVVNEFGMNALKSMTDLTTGEERSFSGRTSGNTCGAGTIIHLARQHGWTYQR
jgi:hypothetical protein